MTNPNIPPEIADATPAPSPVRISPELPATLLLPRAKEAKSA